MTFAHFLFRLRRVRRSGQGYDAECPSPDHDDQHQSLSVAESEDGRILLKCHRGCPPEAIVAALGLTMRDLFPADNGAQARRIVATYDYHDEAGKLLYQVVRFDPKDFRCRRPDGRGGWIWTLGATRRVLYHLDELEACHPAYTYIGEGERDADRLRSLGLPATCNPGGAGKWREEYSAQLKAAGVGQVIILQDNDRVGDAHALQVARSCLAAGLKVKRPRLPGLPPLQTKHGEDVSDWLDAGHTAEELAAVVEAEPELTAEDLEGVSAPPSPGPVLVRVAEVEAEEVAWQWPARVAVGKLTLIIGDPGLGKSLLTLDMSARSSRGTSWPDGGVAPRGDVILLSAEDGLADTIRPRLEAAGADLEHVYVLRAVRDDAGERHFTLARDLTVLEQAITQTGAVLAILDPASAYLGDKDSYKDAEVRALLAPLAALAERRRVAVVAVMHLTKDQQRRALYRALGSVAFVAAARMVLAVALDPEDPDRRVMVTIKNNLARPAPGLAFGIVESPGGAPVLAWEREPVADADADRFLGPGPSAEERAEGQEADDFLREILATGRVKAEMVFTAARKTGIAERTLYRAKRRLRVHSEREGYGASGDWYWSLPFPATAPSKTATPREVAAFDQAQEKKAESAPTSPKIATPLGMAAFDGGRGNLSAGWGEV